MYLPWESIPPPDPSPHTIVFRIGRIRWIDFPHENGSVRHYSLRIPSASDFKEHNDKTLRRIVRLGGGVTGLYNPKTKVYVEFTGTNGDETDISHFKDLSEEDVIWETVYAGDDGPLLSYPFRMLFSHREGKPMIPSLVHDDIKRGYYLPTWRESFSHSWKRFWGMVPKVSQEASDSKKKDE
ncbi:hypothetical protein TWF506_001896 [Arthrobotrys conoides]|uniref:Uncharacterized protein n=1 Tax=Arthrobotrys conoides TaxID=74498 RepID=A0AAN8NTW8_9PEZI